MILLRRYGTLFALALIVAVFSLASPGAFGTVSNLVNITQQMSLLAIVAIGATLVMVLGEFDLSVSAVVSWAGIAAVSLFSAGWPIALVFPVVLVSALLMGMVSGILVARFALPSFIATLALGTVIGGLTFWVSDGATLFSGIPPAFRDLGRGAILGVPVPTLWLAAVAAIFWLLLDQTEFGRRLYAIGGNREAARLVGLPVRRDMVTAFALCAGLAALAGLLLAARLGSAHPTGGGGYLLQAYAAVFLGMTAFREGEPSLPGTLVGAAIIAVISNGLTILGVPSFLQDVMTGAIIIAAVMIRHFGRVRD
ncbi:ABC transporter permease [Kaistia algarum]|uniref:ABC transporter permease n=1 Tax=Kaistia algarum TaxID=2083279 RepID=UPI000CE92CE7|nr:ABC transporter permease [Kaistia algarum]MCX5513489.1 ABC transporter permease [Kaistia algarum]PPE78119.1 ABC transporter permease [Kaistia algarum]